MNKYRARKTLVDGILFDSKREADRYGELKLLERAGEITDLELQKPYTLIPTQYKLEETGEVYAKGRNRGKPKYRKVCKERSAIYIADFVYKDKHGYTIVEDAKGKRTEAYILKRKLMLYIHGIEIKEI